MLPAVWQAVVSGAHFPLVQVPPQQEALEEHAWLSEMQAVAPHFPFTQLRLQHSVDEPQLAPPGVQVPVLAAQVCDAVSHSVEQQSAPDWQRSPYL